MLKTIASVLAGVALAAQAGQPSDLPSIAAKLQQAVLDGNGSGIKAGRAACIALLDAAPASPNAPLIRYTIAYADWRLAYSPAASEKEKDEMLEDAQAQLIKAKHDDQWFADELALLSAVYGGRAARNPDLAMTLGPEAWESLKNAADAAPSNPRVMIMQGIFLMHTPAEYGGDPRRAEELFRVATKAFDAAPANAPWPNWGRVDAHMWLGQALAARGDNDGARAEYNAALALAPNNGYVKGLLANLK